MPLNGYLHVTSISVNLSNLLIDQISSMLTYENTCRDVKANSVYQNKPTFQMFQELFKIQVPKQNC